MMSVYWVRIQISKEKFRKHRNARKKVGLEVNIETAKHVFMSCHQTAGQDNYI
jgi:hypothetical protein